MASLNLGKLEAVAFFRPKKQASAARQMQQMQLRQHVARYTHLLLSLLSPRIPIVFWRLSTFDAYFNIRKRESGCSVDFENQNYTILTSQCKGPQYTAKLCCGAFKEFACPFAEQINDQTTDCASTMFSYINLYGKYPPGLFANECKEGKEGLDCSMVPQAAPAVKASVNASGGELAAKRSLSMMFLGGSVALLLQFF